MILGVDFGLRRVGLAVADPETRFARPLEVVDAGPAVARIAALVRELGISKVVVGLPVGLSGGKGPAVEAQAVFVRDLAAATGVAIHEFDERFTTVVAERRLRFAGAGAGGRKRIRDAVAAQVMLQGYLDSYGATSFEEEA